MPRTLEKIPAHGDNKEPTETSSSYFEAAGRSPSWCRSAQGLRRFGRFLVALTSRGSGASPQINRVISSWTPRVFWSRILQPFSKLDCLTSGWKEQEDQNHMAPRRFIHRKDPQTKVLSGGGSNGGHRNVLAVNHMQCDGR